MLSYILMIAIGVIGSNSLLLSPILNDISNDFSVLPVQVAYAITAYNAITALSALYLARFIDDWGVHKALVAAYACLVAGTAISAISWNLPVLIIGQSLTGLGAGVSLPAIYALAPMIAPKGQETKIVGRVLTGWSLALVAGVPAAAFLSELFGWRSAYYLMFSLSLLTFVLMLKMAGSFSNIGTQGQKKTTKPWNILAPFNVKGATILLLMNLLYMASFYGTYSFLGTYLRDIYNATTIEAGYAVLAYGIGFGIASFADPTVDKFGVRQVSAYIFGLLSLTYFSLSFTYSSPNTIYLICIGWGFLNHLGLSSIITLLGEIETEIKGQLMGMNSVFTYVGGSLGTTIFGYFYIKQGFFLIALTAASAIGILTLVFIFFVRNINQRHYLKQED